MRHARVYGIAALATLAAIAVGAAAAAFAQTTVTPLPDNVPVQAAPLDASAVADLAKAHWGDAKAGAVKAGACAACHGLDGNPSDPQYPRLAGQHAKYVAKQLTYIQTLTRAAPVMHGIVKDLTPAEIQAVAIYVQSK